MSLYKGNDIDPELVAAYFDGEFEGRDDTASLRRQVEAWLTANPDARTQLADYRRLRQLWQQTSPAEPRGRPWEKVLAGVRQQLGQSQAGSPRRPARSWLWWASAAACIGLVGLAWTRLMPVQAPSPRDHFVSTQSGDEDLPWTVARADEVTILGVEGEDTGTVVVGELPLKGKLELATQDEIRVTSMQPDLSDNMVPRVRGNRPMIWAVAESERD